MTKAVNDINKSISKNWNLSCHQSSHKICMCAWKEKATAWEHCFYSLSIVFQILSSCQENLRSKILKFHHCCSPFNMSPLIYSRPSAWSCVNNVKNVVFKNLYSDFLCWQYIINLLFQCIFIFPLNPTFRINLQTLYHCSLLSLEI